MNVYSSHLRAADLTWALEGIQDVRIDSEGITRIEPRQSVNPYSYGYRVFLEGVGDRHHRARQGGVGRAATWDDHGVWMARLFSIDKGARIATYKGRADFVRSTRRTRDHYASSRHGNDDHTAPWLEFDVTVEGFQWPRRYRPDGHWSEYGNVEWCRGIFAALAEGGAWGVPRSGLTFRRHGDSLYLIDYDRSGTFGLGLQEADFLAIRDTMAEADVTVLNETRLLQGAPSDYSPF